MNHRMGSKQSELEDRIVQAITIYQTSRKTSIRNLANTFQIPLTTLRRHMAGGKSRAEAHETEQTLSNVEESCLARWITRLSRSGYSVSPRLALEMAEEVRTERVQLSRRKSSDARPIGYSWLDRFRTRFPEIQGLWTRQLESARYNGANYETVRAWFDAVTELVQTHQYAPEHIYNMDESGFAVGKSQSSRVLVNVRESTSWKVIQGRSEWITAIECVSAAGEAIPPLLIYKAKNLNTGWIPSRTPPNWRFSTSNSGWTSDLHAFEWVSSQFEPYTRPEDPAARRLLIMDGHGSHITAKFIAFCMQSKIDLLILPPHTSHILQPLDIAVFSRLRQIHLRDTILLVFHAYNGRRCIYEQEQRLLHPKIFVRDGKEPD